MASIKSVRVVVVENVRLLSIELVHEIVDNLI
jgi:hypothetical protein